MRSTAAVAAQCSLTTTAWPGALPVTVGMGLHTGDASDQPGHATTSRRFDLASGLADLAHGGQILGSSATADLAPPRSTSSRSDGTGCRDSPSGCASPRSRREGLASALPPAERPIGRQPALGPVVVRRAPPGAGRPSHRARQLPRWSRSSAWVASARPAWPWRRDICTKPATARGSSSSGASTLPDQVDESWRHHLASAATWGRQAERRSLAWLADRETLLILDNCEHLLGCRGRAGGGDRAAASDTTVLATSREPLGTRGERLFALGALSLPGQGVEQSEVVALFLDRAGPGTLDDESRPSQRSTRSAAASTASPSPSSWPQRG